MAGNQLWRKPLPGLIWAILALMPAGCMAIYPLPNDPIPNTNKASFLGSAETTPDWAVLPQQSKNHVYVYLLNGNDPFNSDNLCGVRDYLHARGFIKTSYGQQYHGPWIEAEIRDLAQTDPHARFVLVGFSAAAGFTHGVARRLGEDGITVDRLIYLDGVFLIRNSEGERPEKVHKFVNVRSQSWIVHAEERESADNILVEGAGHFDIPTHPKTLKTLMRELTEVASKVPTLVELPPPLPEDRKPTPTVDATISIVPPEWDFLRQDVIGVNAPRP